MRKLVFLAFCLSTFFVDAQVLNSKGQKMVERIEAYLPDCDKPYVIVNFDYNISLELEKIRLCAPLTKTIIWEKNGLNLKRTQFNNDNTLNKDYTYKYKLNKYNVISECLIDVNGNDGSVLRHKYVYGYNVYCQMDSINKRTFYSKNRGQYTELSDREDEYFFFDSNGDAFSTGLCPYQWKIGQGPSYDMSGNTRQYYYELTNDTNIDLGMLYTYFALCDRFEMVTEWCGNHSLHLLERDKGNYFDYEYENEYGGNSSSNDRGNILSVNVYLFDRLRVKYNIFYKVQ